MDALNELLPGQALSSSGRPRLDYLAVSRLAFPFMLNSAVQAVLNATDTWFVGRLSPAATSAMGAVYWPVLVFILLFGGVGLSVQTLVAHAYGGRRYARASQATWTALWASLFTLPACTVLALTGFWIFSPFGIPSETLDLALAYWFPRILAAPLGIALWSLLGFFNGIGRPAITLRITLIVAVLNAVLNQVFIFDLGLGVAGSAWATAAAQLAGVALALAGFLSKTSRRRYRSHLTTRLRMRALRRQLSLGFPMGLLSAADILGFALFQLMQVRLGNADGAATQIVMMLTSFCYMPAVGIAMAGTTLVGQAIGAKNPDWAGKVGNGIIAIAVLYMGLDRFNSGGSRSVAAAPVHQRVRPPIAAGRGDRLHGALDRRRLPIVRRPQHQQRLMSSRRRRRAPTGPHGARVVVDNLRAARAHSVIQTGCRVGRLAAAGRMGRSRRLARRTRLYLPFGNDVVSALALRRVAVRGVAAALSRCAKL